VKHILLVSDGKLYQVFFWNKDDIVAIEYLNQFNEWVPIERDMYANFGGDMACW
jgi:hypothetical protein